MVVSFKNSVGKEFLAVGVPLDAVKASVHDETLWLLFEGDDFKNPQFPYQDLPDGKWKIIGISSELTEEQIIELGLVGELQLDKQKGYLDYLNEHVSFRFESAKESLQSRLKSFGFVLENPFTPPWKLSPIGYNKNKFKWKEAESKIVKVLILEKL